MLAIDSRTPLPALTRARARAGALQRPFALVMTYGANAPYCARFPEAPYHRNGVRPTARRTSKAERLPLEQHCRAA